MGYDLATVALQIVCKTDARAEVVVVAIRKFGEGTADRLEFLKRPASRNRTGADKVEVLIPTNAEVQRQTLSDLPVVLEEEAQLLGAAGHIEVGIAGTGRHTNDGSRGSETLRVESRLRQNVRIWSVPADKSTVQGLETPTNINP